MFNVSANNSSFLHPPSAHSVLGRFPRVLIEHIHSNSIGFHSTKLKHFPLVVFRFVCILLAFCLFLFGFERVCVCVNGVAEKKNHRTSMLFSLRYFYVAGVKAQGKVSPTSIHSVIKDFPFHTILCILRNNINYETPILCTHSM